MEYNPIDTLTGVEKKRIVEHAIERSRKAGIPMGFSDLNNPNHDELLYNLNRGYSEKEDYVISTYGRVGNSPNDVIVGENYTDVVRPIEGEAYPDKKITKELFKERDLYRNQIIQLQQEKGGYSKLGIKDLGKVLKNIKKEYPIIKKIESYVEDYDSLMLHTGEKLTVAEIEFLLDKNKLDINEAKRFEKIYKKYAELKKTYEDKNEEYYRSMLEKDADKDIEILQENIKEIEVTIFKLNLKLVNGYLRQNFRGLMVEKEDLFSLCSTSLWEAIRKFDVSIGKEFSTFAYPYMTNEIRSNFKTLTGSRWDVYWNRQRIKRMLESVSEDLKRPANLRDLEDLGLLAHLNLDYISAQLIMNEFYPVSELFDLSEEVYDEVDVQNEEALLDNDEPIDYPEPLDDYTSDKAYDDTETNDLRKMINAAINTLTDRERKVLEERFGLVDGHGKTLDEVGDMFNVTSQRIRAIEAKALRKLRHPARVKFIKEYRDLDSRIVDGVRTMR